jgi:hypothetical protein
MLIKLSALRTLFPIAPEQGRFASKKWYFDKALSDRY